MVFKAICKARIAVSLMLFPALWAATAIAAADGDLIQAATRGNLREVKRLVAKGADVNAKADHGYTALMVASRNGHSEVVKLLLAKGADVNARSSGGETALILASRENAKKQLIMAGASSSSEPGVVIASPRIMDLLKTF
jgi:hypothetical protein